ncbi:cytochrome P450 [Bailinhaonella thermotolerans]|uniref:Cytochrome P450 n=1 Tax=Bailinhaonella thermotolerans TaxID=1070861 RepID=A0A3A4AFU1_9ACTN|nr:cytochrome P450 [Bailinhaonella thermotolerans]RJL27219.1 cytochrome P450 [Bailinhaonella thermotolerans]
MSAVALPPKFDVFDPALLDDPYPTYARLREAGALCRAGPATWAVTRHAEVTALLRDPRLGHGVPDGLGRPALLPGREPYGDVVERVLGAARPNAELPGLVSALDPPAHPRVRGLLARALNPAAVRRLTGLAARTAGDLLDGVGDGPLDAVGDFALPLQTRVACDMLGVPAADRDEVAALAAELGRAIILIPFVTPERGNGEPEARRLKAYARGLIAERRARPGPDLVSRMLAVRQGADSLSDEEVADNAVFLFFAGFETTVHLVGGGALELAGNPGQYARLRADRSLIPSAVEELLRYDPPLQWISRTTAEPVEIEGRTLRPGRFLLLLLASANRDERAFAAPDRLDVGRRPNPHLGFGGGAHHCLGVLLARAVGAAALGALVSRAAAIEPAGEPVRRRHPNVRGLISAPLSLRPA